MRSAVKTRLYLAQHQTANIVLNLAADDKALNDLITLVWLYQM